MNQNRSSGVPGAPTSAPLAIQEQGSFAVGGAAFTAPGQFDPYRSDLFYSFPPVSHGQTFHGDHAAVFYQVPVDAKPLPLVFLHGGGQSMRCWGTTPDGREGFQTLFLRRGFPVYVVDQPRRGGAGRSMQATRLEPTPDEQGVFNLFRIGMWPNYFPGVQFSRDPAALNQYFRAMTPETGPFDLGVMISAASELFNRIGAGILVTHSQSGGTGWQTAARNPHVRAVISFEPGTNFAFPEGEVPPPIPSSGGSLEARGIPMAEFTQLTKIPIVIYYGDNIPAAPAANPGQDRWRARLAMARLWRDAVNQRGGNVSVVHLPEIGIHGNTHFPFSDLNNLDVAGVVSKFITSNGLDV